MEPFPGGETMGLCYENRRALLDRRKGGTTGGAGENIPQAGGKGGHGDPGVAISVPDRLGGRGGGEWGDPDHGRAVAAKIGVTRRVQSFGNGGRLSW